MYQIMSSHFGQLSTKPDFESAKYWAESYRTKSVDGETITVWKDGVQVYPMVNQQQKGLNKMTTNRLITVNPELIVMPLKQHNDVILCVNIETGEYVTWWIGLRGYSNGHYTFNLQDAISDFRARSGYTGTP